MRRAKPKKTLFSKMENRGYFTKNDNMIRKKFRNDRSMLPIYCTGDRWVIFYIKMF